MKKNTMKTIKNINLKPALELLQNVSPKKLIGVKLFVKIFKTFFVNPERFYSFIKWLADVKQNYKLNTQHRHSYDLLNAIKLTAIKNQNIDTYIYKKILSENRPKRPRRTKERGDLLTPQEIKSIRKLNIPNIDRKYILIIFEYCASTRIFETVKIKLEDCRIDGDIVEIIIRRGKGNRQRVSFIPTKLFLKIKEIFNSKEYLFEYCFSTGMNKPYTIRCLQKWHEEISLALRKRVHAHLLKHCFITHQLDNKTDVSIVSRIVGTSPQVIYETYNHPDFKPRQIMKIQTRGIKI